MPPASRRCHRRSALSCNRCRCQWPLWVEGRSRDRDAYPVLVQYALLLVRGAGDPLTSHWQAALADFYPARGYPRKPVHHHDARNLCASGGHASDRAAAVRLRALLWAGRIQAHARIADDAWLVMAARDPALLPPESLIIAASSLVQRELPDLFQPYGGFPAGVTPARLRHAARPARRRLRRQGLSRARDGALASDPSQCIVTIEQAIEANDIATSPWR